MGNWPTPLGHRSMSNPSLPTPDPAGPPDRHATRGGSTAHPELTSRSTDAGPLPPATLLPEQFGRYHIRGLLGKGGMGEVYLAHDTQLDRLVALKVPRFRPETGSRELERFYVEARSAARLQHPHICPVFDVNEINGVHHLTMAYIEGQPLSELVAAYAPNPREAVVLVRTLALALEEAHRQGVIHRDLKPANVMINQRGEPVIMDFGLARTVQARPAHHTHLGTVLG